MRANIPKGMGGGPGNMQAMMRQAQKILPDGCWQDEVIDMIFDLYEKYPDDWRRAVINAETMVNTTEIIYDGDKITVLNQTISILIWAMTKDSRPQPSPRPSREPITVRIIFSLKT